MDELDPKPTVPMMPPLPTAEELVAELRQTIDDRAPLVRARVAGRRGFLELQLKAQGLEQKRSATWWAYLAHLGTLDKLQTLLSREGVHRETLQILSVARNVFENLVWLKLINMNGEYGLVFYAQLLTNQMDNYEGYIEKLTAEADMFDVADELDGLELDKAYETVFAKGDEATREDWGAANSDHNSRQAELDDIVRREFSLYAGPARFNGYKYQAALLRTKAIPFYQSLLTEVREERAALLEDLPRLVPEELLGQVNPKSWNWRGRASDVRMEKHYDFLYRYTSKLLHATPLNIISDKEMSDAEARIMVDYIVVAVGDILDQIERFDAPGQVDALGIYVGSDETD